MRKNLLFYLSFLCAFYPNLQTFGQACSGSLGDPVVRQTFPSTGALPSGQTNYTYVNSTCPSDGSYSVQPSTPIPVTGNSCFGNSWQKISDHTAGGGTNIMIINAAYTAGEFYKQTVSGLCGSSTYEFSSWVVNLLNTNACTSNANRFPNLLFRIETTSGTAIKTFTTGNITSSGVWERKATFFTTPAGISSVVLKIINNAPGGCGNDLAIDDIEFRPCGPTLSLTSSGGTTLCTGQSVILNSSLTAGYANPVYQW